MRTPWTYFKDINVLLDVSGNPGHGLSVKCGPVQSGLNVDMKTQGSQVLFHARADSCLRASEMADKMSILGMCL